MTAANRTRFEDDLKRLISEGRDMTLRLYLEADEDGFLETFKKNSKEIQRVRALPRFGARYQLWYSQAKAAVSVSRVPER